TNVLAWLFRKVRQVCEGGLRCRTMYLATLVSPMVMPNLSSSPWMWGAPHRGLSRLICRIKSRTSRGTAGRPGLAAAHFPGPEQAKALAMPRDDGLRPDDGQRRAPVLPNTRQDDP